MDGVGVGVVGWRQREGAVVCASCGRLVGVRDSVCLHCGRRHPGLWGWTPVLRRLGEDLGLGTFLVGGCLVLYGISLLLSPESFGLDRNPLRWFAPRLEALYLLGASGAVPVFGLGRWWTVLSAPWLHGSLLHLLFNLAWARQLVPATAHLYGPGRMLLLWFGTSAAGFLTSSVAGAFLPRMPLLGGRAAFTLGASASIFGLLGALLVYGRRSGQRALTRQVGIWTATAGVMGLLLPGIDNWAHVGGLVTGVGLSQLLRPLHAERIDHLVAGLLLLVASLLAVIASVLTGIS